VTLKIGVVGCGKQAVKHIGGLRRCGDIEIVVADKDEALARQLAQKENLASVDTPERIFADPAVGAVVICVPTPFHAPLISRALAAGKDFFCEKPLCGTVAEARDLYRLVQGSDRVGMIGYVYRQTPVFQQIKAILAGARDTGTSPVIGRIAVATMRIGGRGSAALWKHKASAGGGAVNEMLVHMLDLAVWYFGPIVEAELLMDALLRPQRRIAGRLETADAEDFVVARFRTSAGVSVVIQADLVTPAFSQALEVQGDNGSVMASIQAEMPQFVYAIAPAGGYDAGFTPLGGGNADLFAAQMAAFVAELRERRLSAAVNLADAVAVMEALELLRGGNAAGALRRD
jgi:myo-inositol 2-dehydrogenase/D-chiro-inositol 1-dehydrogenase